MRERNAGAVPVSGLSQNDVRIIVSFLSSGLQGPEGDRTVAMALANPDKFVLKPQREGGGKVTSACPLKKPYS